MVRARHRKSKRFVQHKRRWATVKSVKVVVVAIIVIVSAVYILNREGLVLSSVIVEGNENVSAEVVRDQVLATLSGSYFGLVPHSSAFFYPRGDIRRDVLDSFTEIGEVRIWLRDMRTLVVAVNEREPYALWCKASVGMAGGQKNGMEKTPTASLFRQEECYLLDANGFAFKTNPVLLDRAYFRFYGAGNGGQLPSVGNRYLGEAEFKSISRFLSRLKETPLVVFSLTVLEDEMEVGIGGGGGVLRFLRIQKLSKLLSSLEAVVESDAFRGRDLDELEYIDLRFGNKIYYRFNGEETYEK